MQVLVNPVIEKFFSMRELIERLTTHILVGHLPAGCIPPRVCQATLSHLVTFTVGEVADPRRPFFGFRVYPEDQERTPPTVANHITVAYEPDGRIDAIVVSDRVGEWRCGALGGIAIKLLAESDSEIAAVLGCGRQAYMQILGACAVRKLSQIKVYSRSEKNRRMFAETIARDCSVSAVAVETAEMAVRDADIIVSATNSAVPVFDKSCLKANVHINHIGPKYVGRMELPPAVYDCAGIVATDSLPQAIANREVLNGSISRKVDVIQSLEQLLRMQALRRKTDTSVYCSLGLSGSDVLVAHMLAEVSRLKFKAYEYCV